MKEKTYAAIDIGSNAVRLLVKRSQSNDSKSPDLKKLLLLRVPLRLGFDVFAKGKVSAGKADDLVRLMKAYRLLMKIYDVDTYRACATSAMRDAENGKQIIRKIEEETDIRIEIIPGDEEAKIVYNNHIERTGTPDGNYLYVDVGGGSTEINLLSAGELKVSKSFNIGTVRILTGKVKPSEWTRLDSELEILASQYGNITIIGSGGNINKLYKMATRDEKGGDCLTVAQLSRIYHLLKPLSCKERMDRYDLKPDRADVIIPAAEIFLNIAGVVDANKIIVPVIGVADGIIDGLYESDCK